MILATLTLGATAPDPPRSYIASLAAIELKSGEAVSGFSLNTWGVEFKAVCNIPLDWEVTVGAFGPGGKLAGSAGHGASWMRAKDLTRLHALVLIELSGPVQRHDRRNGTGVVPATFAGYADVQSAQSERPRKLRLTFANVTLVPAKHCPVAN